MWRYYYKSGEIWATKLMMMSNTVNSIQDKRYENKVMILELKRYVYWNIISNGKSKQAFNTERKT